MSGPKTLYFKQPSSSEPGYLLRQRKAREFVRALDREFSPAIIEEIIEFLSPYIKDEGGAELGLEEAEEYLLMASSDQFFAMLIAMMGAEREDGEEKKAG